MDFDNLYKMRQNYLKEKNEYQKTLAISYDYGVSILESQAKTLSHNMGIDIEKLLMREDRNEIKNYLNKTLLFGMKLVIFQHPRDLTALSQMIELLSVTKNVKLAVVPFNYYMFRR